MDIYKNFLDIAASSINNQFFAFSISKFRADFLAKSIDGNPVFLFHDASSSDFTPGLVLKNLTVDFHVTCRVQTETGTTDGQFAVVTCDDSVPELFEVFIRCFRAAADNINVGAGTNEIRNALQNLLDLFRGMSQPSGRAVSGLWAELFVIAHSHQIPSALEAWRNSPAERFDFSWKGRCLEVKSTTGPYRVHEFGLEQLQPPGKEHGYVCSMLLQQLNGGIGVIDLALMIESNIHGLTLLRQKLWNNIASALGSGFSNKLDTRFDKPYAARNLSVYYMSEIPAPPLPLDRRVSGIRFQSDISAVCSSITRNGITVLRTIF